MRFPTFKHELEFLSQGYTLVAGCDEAGRGPLAGPVVAAACILDPADIVGRRSKSKWYARIRDSKTVPEEEREILAREIMSRAVAWGIGVVSEEEIDRQNIHRASLEAMRLAVLDTIRKATKSTDRLAVLVDGKFQIPELSSPRCAFSQKSLIDGDAQALSVAAASIIAKVHRDGIMRRLDGEFPGYGFGRHKGYGTKEHLAAIRKFGVTSVHRKTFVKI